MLSPQHKDQVLHVTFKDTHKPPPGDLQRYTQTTMHETRKLIVTQRNLTQKLDKALVKSNTGHKHNPLRSSGEKQWSSYLAFLAKLETTAESQAPNHSKPRHATRQRSQHEAQPSITGVVSSIRPLIFSTTSLRRCWRRALMSWARLASGPRMVQCCKAA